METTKLPRRKVIRLQGYDYSLPGNYFVTIVVQDRLCLFGSIANGQMQPNPAAIAMEQALMLMTQKFPDIMLQHFIIMPNHIHLIITITGQIDLCEVIRTYKSYTTHLYCDGVRSKGWQTFNKKLWQRSFYEHIIRNQHAYDYIANYIATNPQRWSKDAINPNHDDDKDEMMKQVLMFG